MAQLIYIPVTPIESDVCPDNCVTIIDADDSIRPIGPIEGWVFVYTPDDEQVFGETEDDPVLVEEQYANQ